jgi:hypothetical protein
MLASDVPFPVSPNVGVNAAGIKDCDVGIGFGRDKSLRYSVDSKNGHVVQGFSPEILIIN